jgi:ribonuclease BN (tRNA processing enzyme)
MRLKPSRRQFLAGSLGALGATVAPRRQQPRQAGNSAALRLILLGTSGGPTPKASRAAPAQVILYRDAAFVVDCGNGVARQLRLAGVPLTALRHVFLTHHHSDHNADYGTLLLLAWASDLVKPVDTWGPPPLGRMTTLFLEMSQADIAVRVADEGRPALAPLIRPHEITKEGVVLRDGDLTVTCARVHHPLVEQTYAYRFDVPGRSVVISGDTSPSQSLVALARGADVLVHEAMYLPAVERMLAGAPNPAALRQHLLDSHTPVEEAGRIAAEAKVKTLVLSHFVPGDTPPVTDAQWLAGAKKHFGGNVVVGRDLLEI